MAFGIQLPQINLPQINIPNPFSGVQSAASNAEQTLSSAFTSATNGAGSIVSSDVTQLYNIGRNVETNYISPVVATGEQGANRIITAGQSIAALPGQAVQGAEQTIYTAGNTIVTDVNNAKNTVLGDINSFFAIPGNEVKAGESYINSQEQGAKDFITQQEQQLQTTFQSDMNAIDDAFNKFFQGIAGVTTPAVTAGADVTKWLILAAGGVVLVIAFLIFVGLRGRKPTKRSG